MDINDIPKWESNLPKSWHTVTYGIFHRVGRMPMSCTVQKTGRGFIAFSLMYTTFLAQDSEESKYTCLVPEVFCCIFVVYTRYQSCGKCTIVHLPEIRSRLSQSSQPSVLLSRNEGQDYSFASDIWSVGMVIFELSTGRYPFAVGWGGLGFHWKRGNSQWWNRQSTGRSLRWTTTFAMFHDVPWRNEYKYMIIYDLSEYQYWMIQCIQIRFKFGCFLGIFLYMSILNLGWFHLLRTSEEQDVTSFVVLFDHLCEQPEPRRGMTFLLVKQH